MSVDGQPGLGVPDGWALSQPDTPTAPGTWAQETAAIGWSGQRKGTTWHLDRGCVRFRRHAASAIAYEAAFGDLPEFLWARSRSTPCATCTAAVLRDAGVRLTAADAPELVLACPKSRFFQDEDHAHCPRCQALTGLASSNDLLVVNATQPRNYPLVVARIAPSFLRAFQSTYVTWPVPKDVEMTAELLDVAWRRRPARQQEMPMPALLVPHSGTYTALYSLDWLVADLLTAPSAQLP